MVAVKQTAVLEQSWVLWVAYHVPHGDLAQRVHAEAQRLLKESANGGDADAQALPPGDEEELLVRDHRDHAAHGDRGRPAEHLAECVAGVFPRQQRHKHAQTDGLRDLRGTLQHCNQASRPERGQRGKDEGPRKRGRHRVALQLTLPPDAEHVVETTGPLGLRSDWQVGLREWTRTPECDDGVEPREGELREQRGASQAVGWVCGCGVVVAAEEAGLDRAARMILGLHMDSVPVGAAQVPRRWPRCLRRPASGCTRTVYGTV